MKKLAILLMAAAMLVGGMGNAQAIDFNVKGQWIMSFEYGQNGNFTGGNGRTGYNSDQDEFEAEQRVRLQLDAVASESLSGSVFFEIGDQRWGKSAHGGALGADGNQVIELRRAYLDWIVPETDLKIRMGIDNRALPSFTTHSQVLADETGGITASYAFNENVAVTAFWARPMNDNYTGYAGTNTRANYMDNVDLVALSVPLTFDGVKLTPWGMYAAIGPNAFRSGDGVNDDYFTFSKDNAGSSWKNFRTGMLPVHGAKHGEKLTAYGNAFWVGLTGDITAFDPFRIAFDVNYGAVSYDDSSANRAGWLASLLAEYKLDWGIVGLQGWYASGDDDNTGNGSERMPYVSLNNTTNRFSEYAFTGDPNLGRETTVGNGMTGTWGVGAYLRDVSFMEDLKHTLHVTFFGGTNSPHMAKEIVAWGGAANSNFMGAEALYLTTRDTALELSLINTYQIYDNLNARLTASYIALWLDKSNSVWGNSKMNGRSDDVRDAWDVSLAFVYDF